jgi:anaerobic selenocysteine-containing dehydrogenase
VADRIADIWGARTPHARDTPWPVRVDLHLEQGLDEADVDRWVQSACVLCSNGCACDIAVKDGRMVGVRGRAMQRVARRSRQLLDEVGPLSHGFYTSGQLFLEE